jgi:hypothetical protein
MEITYILGLIYIIIFLAILILKKGKEFKLIYKRPFNYLYFMFHFIIGSGFIVYVHNFLFEAHFSLKILSYIVAIIASWSIIAFFENDRDY